MELGSDVGPQDTAQKVVVSQVNEMQLKNLLSVSRPKVVFVFSCEQHPNNIISASFLWARTSRIRQRAAVESLYCGKALN